MACKTGRYAGICNSVSRRERAAGISGSALNTSATVPVVDNSRKLSNIASLTTVDYLGPIMNFLKKLFQSKIPPEAARNLSRNADCWCDSGRKYKHCHFDADRSYFASKTSEGCRGAT